MEKRSYSHLTQKEKLHIFELKARGISNVKIAYRLDVHRSTIGRELKRGINPEGKSKGYSPRYSERRYKTMRSLNKPAFKIEGEIKDYVDKKLEEKWSPEQISGRLPIDFSNLNISHEGIYQYIYRDKEEGGNLYKHLRHKGKKYKRRCNQYNDRGIIGRVDIDERPAVVDKKERIGDWEADLVCSAGRDKSVLLTMVERASKHTKIAILPCKEAYLVKEAMLSMMSDLKDKVHTITFDNGREFVHHGGIASGLQADTYFAKPYHSWERGLNEHTNGLIRQFFPKKSSFANITKENVQDVEILLNNRPRKVLGYRTPNEVFCLNYPTHFHVQNNKTHNAEMTC